MTFTSIQCMPIKLFIGTKVRPQHIDQALKAAYGPIWRWTPHDQWHVTALFIGYRPEKDLQDITASITSVAQTTARFTLHDGELKAMPEERPSMLWIRFAVSPELTALNSALAQALGVPPSPYSPYLPHITLARGKGDVPSSFDVPVIHRSPIEELTLFRSDPGPDGTVHTALATWILP